jgi:tetratricopeptide (TPR) repeat protein/predicted Ser/Thr protein kinase
LARVRGVPGGVYPEASGSESVVDEEPAAIAGRIGRFALLRQLDGVVCAADDDGARNAPRRVRPCRGMYPEGPGSRADVPTDRSIDPIENTVDPGPTGRHFTDATLDPAQRPRSPDSVSGRIDDATLDPARPPIAGPDDDATLAPDESRRPTVEPPRKSPAAGNSLIDGVTLAAPAPPAHRHEAPFASDPPWLADSRPTRYPAFERGDLIGRYVVVGVLGEGGMGVVYAAYDPELDRKVAVKLVRARRDDDPDAHTRLLREAQALAQLAHPNVVTVHDVGTLGQRVFLAMEFVDGHTLTDWLALARRRWQDALAPFLAAGEGLARAHAAGLIHRDFKPDNVMVSPDGRVRVMDFGLARATPRPPVVASVERRPSGLTYTQDGALLGTPCYMAAEQWAGAAVDARTDQFAFCVALWHAVHGERPFDGDTTVELVDNVTSGRVRPPSGRAPAWLTRVLLRGLRPNPGERWPDMPALLQAIGRGRVRGRVRWLFVGLAAVALVAVGVALRQSHREAARIAVCDAEAAAIEALWNDVARADLRADFLATGASFAAGTADRIGPWIDNWTAEWSAARRSTCVVVDVHSEPAAACLDDSLDELATLLRTLRSPDRTTLARAVPAAAALPPIADCTDPHELARRPTPPADPAVRARLLALRTDLHVAQSLQATSHFEEADARLAELLPRVEAEGHPLVLAQARLTAGTVAQSRGDPARAEEQLLRVFADAGAVGLDDLAAAAAIRLVRLLGFAGQRHAEALNWARVGDMLVRRLGRSEGLLGADLLAQRGYLHTLRSDFAAADRDLARALELRTALLGPDHPQLAESETALGEAARRAGVLDVALAHHERALALREATLGPDHPDTAGSLNNIALVHTIRNDTVRPGPLFERALKIYESGLAKEDPLLANTIVNLARARKVAGDLDAAITLVDRGLAVWERLPDHNHTNYTYALGVRADILADRHEYDLAIAAFARQLAELEAKLGPEHLEIAGVLRNYALVHQQRGDPAAALPLIDRAIAIEEKAVGPDYSWVLENRYFRASILADLHRAPRPWPCSSESSPPRPRPTSTRASASRSASSSPG